MSLTRLNVGTVHNGTYLLTQKRGFQNGMTHNIKIYKQ